MQVLGRKRYFREYLYRKFTTDREGASICSRPSKKPRRADICWGEFYLYPREFDLLVEHAFGAYCDRVGIVSRPV